MQGEEPSSNYVRTHPSDQNAVDIFKGEWSSKFPDSFKISTGGTADLFEDQRITWAESQGVVFKGKTVLELGPLEAGHTWMIDQRGPKEILAIEAHERAYLRCLIVKELTQMKSARFFHGNFDEFLDSNDKHFDICLASGVLYHSIQPVKLLNSICRCCDQLILWTHYFDEAAIREHAPALFKRIGDVEHIEHQGHSIQLHPFHYQEEASKEGFCGGLNSNSLWLEKSGIESILAMNGFKITANGFDHPHHPNGPAIAMIAQKSKS
jgi:hypothetical protein